VYESAQSLEIEALIHWGLLGYGKKNRYIGAFKALDFFYILIR
jgi:hypothetical protein